MLHSADLLLLLDTPGRRIGVPAKLYEYVGARRPVLALAERDGDTALVLRNSGLPYRTESDWTAATLQDSIVSLVKEAIKPCGSLCDASPVNFTREESARRLALALNRLVGTL